MDGVLRHDPDDGFIKIERTDAYMSDMIVSATFVNPYSAASNNWDYGFIIREEGGGGPEIHIEVTSHRQWNVNWRSNGMDADTSQEIASGRLNNFDTRAGGRNFLWLLATGGRGLLFINSEFISMLDLSAHTGAGDVAVATGFYKGGEVSGAVTRYEDFKGSRLTHSYGPASGRLEYEPGIVLEHVSGVWTADFVAEAEFVNPSGSNWDYGFLFRDSASDQLEVIGIASDHWWHHYTDFVGDVVDSQRLPSGSLRNRNHLILMTIGDTGYFFVNGQLITLLDLSHNFDYGSISVMGNLFNDNTGEPQFRNFNVWTMD